MLDFYMGKSLFLMLGTPALLGLSSLTSASDDAFYGGFELGLAGSPRSVLDRGADTLRLEIDKKFSVVGGLYFGKKVGKRRVEFNYSRRRNDFRFLDGEQTGRTGLTGRTSAGGTQKKDSFMINGWQEILGDTDWSLLGGVGVGLSHVSVSRLRTNLSAIADGDKWLPTVQAMVQVVKPLGRGLEAGLGYRYMHNFEADFDSNMFDYQSVQHEVFARISWRFGGAEAQKSAPMLKPIASVKPISSVKSEPAPKPAPVVELVAPAPLPKPFIVYFDFDQSDITAPAARMISEAAQAYKDFKSVRLMATGHTDRAGTAAYNADLAQKRAEAVKAALSAEGVPSHRVSIDYKGETAPAVITADGLREHKNRRVEIEVVR